MAGKANRVPQGSSDDYWGGLDAPTVPPRSQAGAEGWAEKEEMGLQEALVGGGVTGAGAGTVASKASAASVEAVAATAAMGSTKVKGKGVGATDSLEWSAVGTECKKRVFVCTNR